MLATKPKNMNLIYKEKKKNIVGYKNNNLLLLWHMPKCHIHLKRGIHNVFETNSFARSVVNKKFKTKLLTWYWFRKRHCKY